MAATYDHNTHRNPRTKLQNKKFRVYSLLKIFIGEIGQKLNMSVLSVECMLRLKPPPPVRILNTVSSLHCVEEREEDSGQVWLTLAK